MKNLNIFILYLFLEGFDHKSSAVLSLAINALIHISLPRAPRVHAFIDHLASQQTPPLAIASSGEWG